MLTLTIGLIIWTLGSFALALVAPRMLTFHLREARPFAAPSRRDKAA